jgi:hypothetical protein
MSSGSYFRSISDIISIFTFAGMAVVELQSRLPRARVVYCSATGVSDVASLFYFHLPFLVSYFYFAGLS